MPLDLYGEARKAARHARADLGLSPDAAIPDLVESIESAGKWPIAVLPLPKDVAGAFVVERGQGFLFVNLHSDVGRQRFTLAHEFGHARLGHANVVDTVEDVFVRATSSAEKQANAFAANFLAPEPAIRAWLSALDVDEDSIDLEVLVRTAAHFGMSPPAMRWQLVNTRIFKDAKFLEPEVKAGEHIQLRYRLGISPKWDTLSSVKQAGTSRVPSQLYALGVQGYENGSLSLDRLAAAIGASPEELAAELQAKGIEPPPGEFEAETPADLSPELAAEFDALFADDMD